MKEFPEVVPVAHFHDSRGTGIVNYLAAYEVAYGILIAPWAGVGGHPTEVKYGVALPERLYGRLDQPA